MKGERGFTLVETLIAFAILAVTLVALYEAMGTSLSGFARASRFDEAVLIAESRLTELAALPTLPDAAFEGAVEGTRYRWRVEQIPDTTPEPPELASSPLRPQKVKLTISWQDNGARRQIAVEQVLLVPRQSGR